MYHDMLYQYTTKEHFQYEDMINDAYHMVQELMWCMVNDDH